MFSWRDEYEIGIEEIDKDHREFVEYYNKYKSKMENAETSNSRYMFVESMLTYMKNTYDDHVQKEEAHMMEMGYREYALHVSLHEEFKEMYIDRIDRVLRHWNKNEKGVIFFVDDVTRIFLNHILTTDGDIKRYAEYIERSERYSAENMALEDKANALFEQMLDKNIHAKIVNDDYQGTSFGRAIYMKLEYGYKEERLVLLFGFEQKLLFDYGEKIHGEKLMLDITFVLSTIQKFKEQFMEAIAAKFKNYILSMRLQETQFLTLDEMRHELTRHKIKTSVMFETDNGRFFISSNETGNINKRV